MNFKSNSAKYTTLNRILFSDGLLPFNRSVVHSLKELLLEVVVFFLSPSSTFNGVIMECSVLLNESGIFGNLDAEQFIAALGLHGFDNILNVLHLLYFLV